VARMVSGSPRTRSSVAALLVFTAVRMGSSFLVRVLVFWERRTCSEERKNMASCAT
jgi:hypothetical protein